MVLAFPDFQTAVQALINPVKEMGEMTMEVSRRNPDPDPFPPTCRLASPMRSSSE